MEEHPQTTTIGMEGILETQLQGQHMVEAQLHTMRHSADGTGSHQCILQCCCNPAGGIYNRTGCRGCCNSGWYVAGAGSQKTATGCGGARLQRGWIHARRTARHSGGHRTCRGTGGIAKAHQEQACPSNNRGAGLCPEKQQGRFSVKRVCD